MIVHIVGALFGFCLIFLAMNTIKTVRIVIGTLNMNNTDHEYASPTLALALLAPKLSLHAGHDNAVCETNAHATKHETINFFIPLLETIGTT